MSRRRNISKYKTLKGLAKRIRHDLSTKKHILLFAYNGTGKTRLSMEFKDLGKNDDERDTIYFNAFTEDLFTWDNDLENDARRVLRMNTVSRFFNGLKELEMENRIRPFLHRYADVDFEIDYEEGIINFYREIRVQNEDGTEGTERENHIKISRGEENIFIWCFFLAVAQLAIDGQEAYEWVKYLYIDDPISSLDDNNAIAVASHLVHLLKKQDRIKTAISSHHTLFFNVMCNELKVEKKRAQRYFLSKEGDGYQIQNTGDTPRFYHVAMLKELHKVAESGQLYTYHFTILRNILEKTATFHGFNRFSDCIQKAPDDEDNILYSRIINLLSHGNYSLFEPVEMLEENKQHFRNILKGFMKNYRFNPELFPEAEQEIQL